MEEEGVDNRVVKRLDSERDPNQKNRQRFGSRSGVLSIEEFFEDQEVPSWRKQLTFRAFFVSFWLSILFSFIVMKLNLTTGIIPSLNVSAGLLGFFFVKSWTKFLERSGLLKQPFKWYSSCQFSCPRNLGWECEVALPPVPPSTIAAGWDQCGGDGWLGARVCAAGYACYTRSVFYSQCRPVNDCPPGWTCPAIVATTAAPIIQPIVLDAYAKCNNLSNVVCVAGTACFKYSSIYSECRPSCPAGWDCSTEVLAAGEQCGGEVYIGVTRCAPGLNCYVRTKFYSQCAAACPGAGWAC